jgi:nucleoside-diphosphate-sugar epimerase
VKAVVAGATGVVGKRLAEHLVSTGRWDVVGLSRRQPQPAPSYATLAVDLTDAAECREKLSGLRDVTHILYAGRYPHSNGPEPIDINTAMMTNLVEAVEPGNSGLQHIHLVQGSKWYGSTMSAYKTPAREDDPRPAGNHTFYYAQQDWVEARQRGARWTWSASRPHAIGDLTTGIARSLAIVISVYAAILKEEGEPLYFPGTEGNYRAIYQCTDALLLAKAIEWMSTEPRCGNHAFNIINGDYIRWKNVWPTFADYFGMAVGPVRTQKLGVTMPGKSSVWERIARTHDLAASSYEQLVQWSYADFVFHPEWDIMSDTLKARQFGFHEVRDTHGCSSSTSISSAGTESFRAGEDAVRGDAYAGSRYSIFSRLRNVPSANEVGLGDMVLVTWNGVLAPSGTPTVILDRLQKEIAGVMEAPEMHERMLTHASEVTTSSRDEFAAIIRNDLVKWGRLMKSSPNR